MKHVLQYLCYDTEVIISYSCRSNQSCCHLTQIFFSLSLPLEVLVVFFFF